MATDRQPKPSLFDAVHANCRAGALSLGHARITYQSPVRDDGCQAVDMDDVIKFGVTWNSHCCAATPFLHSIYNTAKGIKALGNPAKVRFVTSLEV